MKNARDLCGSLGAMLLLSSLWSSFAWADLLDDEGAASPAGLASPDPASELKTGMPRAQEKSVAKPRPNTPPRSQPSGPTSVKPPKKAGAQAKEPVHFESKGLKGLREKGLVELVDDVVVTQGKFRLEAEKALVYFDEAAHDVVRVVADGNVKIFNLDEKTGEKLKAYGNQVVFFNKDRRVVMEGNARLWRGEDSVIRGKKITYEMDTGWIRADRVAGELAPTEKDKK